LIGCFGAVLLAILSNFYRTAVIKLQIPGLTLFFSEIFRSMITAAMMSL